MTQAFNLSQLANNLNSSGQLDATDGLSGSLPVANGGTGSSSLTANSVLIGSGTSAVRAVAPGALGNVLTSDGTEWKSTPPVTSVTSVNGQTGAVVTTGVDNIGSIICAVYTGTICYNSGQNYFVTTGSTTSGSNLRYNYNFDLAGIGPIPEPKSGTQTTPGSFCIGYGQGGSALSGTWRCISRGAGHLGSFNEDYSRTEVTWYPAMWVRIS